MGRFLGEVEAALGRSLDGYQDLWNWSVAEPEAFWATIRDHFDLPIHGERSVLDLGEESPSGLPGATWFPGARLNAASVLLHAGGRGADELAILARSDARDDVGLSVAALREEVARVRRWLVAAGVGEGDRVAGYLPNVPEAVIAFLATASIGAVWTCCAPEFGVRSVLDRLEQIRPAVVVAVDGYVYGTRHVDRRGEVASIRAALDPSTRFVHLGHLDPAAAVPENATKWEVLDGPDDPGILDVPFDHPLYILFSSGTTGLPKPIVHGHGGITLEHHKALALHGDLGPGDRFFWYTTTGWMMWNYLVSGLAVGAAIVLFDGDPGHPDLGTLWRLADSCRVTALGVGAPFLDACRHAALEPRAIAGLEDLRWLGSTGAPLHAGTARWIAAELPGIPVSSISGGTDVCTAFVGGAPLLPVQAGVIPGRFLGADVAAFDPDGRALIGAEGELVVRSPMPSMPVGLWGDADGDRYRAAYFARYPDVWCHGDWITIAADGRCVISGRSDATLNRGGVRLGTADFYAVVEDTDGIVDSLVVHLDAAGADELVAFLVLEPGRALDEDLLATLRSRLREELSPRHVPDRFVPILEVPRTLSGKKTEVPVKRLLGGAPRAEVLAAGALVNPKSIDEICDWAASRPVPPAG